MARGAATRESTTATTATGSGGEAIYAKNIEKLAAPVSAGGAGANVIVDDLSYPSEPFFQDSLVAAGNRSGEQFQSIGRNGLQDVHRSKRVVSCPWLFRSLSLKC